MTKRTWKQHLTVDRKIVRLLSASTYEDFPSTIRELVSNAYDADATEVKITVDLAHNLIKVTDDGNGMTPEQFGFFLRIAGQQRERRVSPNFGRERIGQFGIGFLAAFPFGKRIVVSSTARRSDIRFEATIPTEQFLKEGQRVIDVGDIDIPGFEVQDDKFKEEHGTTITISPLAEMVGRYFSQKAKPSSRQATQSLFPFDRLRWALTEDLPLAYKDDSPYKKAFSDLGEPGIRVWLNDEELFRNAPGSDILESKEWEYNSVKCRYVITTDWKAIAPEGRGLKQRLKNVGIGNRTWFGLQTEGRAYSRIHWLSGEIRILEGFDNLLSIDRTRFIDSPESDQFREYFKKRLAHFANKVETIAVAKRDIDRQVKPSRFVEVGPRKDVIERNVSRLVSKGFEVKKTSKAEAPSRDQAVTVDVNRKVVEIIDDHPSLDDTVTISSKEYIARYISRGVDGKVPPVRRAEDGAIEINRDYPLFKSIKYGELFLKMLVILLISSEESSSPAVIQVSVARMLKEEFQSLLGS